jgi:hypothetical protein
VPVWLGFVWTLPNTVLGIVLGLFTFHVPRIGESALIFDGSPRGLTALMPRLGRSAMTIGFVIVSSEPVTGTLAAHERQHIRQFCVWGPLFIPVYLVLALPYGYVRHPMEVAARRAAGEVS